MNTNTLAAGVIGFLLGGLVVSTAAWLEDSRPAPVNHSAVVRGLADPAAGASTGMRFPYSAERR